MSIEDAEKAFYDYVMDGDGSLQDQRYAFFLAGSVGAVPFVDPDELENGLIPVWNSAEGRWVPGDSAKGVKGDKGDDGATITSVTRFYCLTSGSQPAKPTTLTPSAPWSTTEPSIDPANPTDTLYMTDRTVLSNGTFFYSDVSLSASFDAAKSAYALTSAIGDAADNKVAIGKMVETDGPALQLQGPARVYDGALTVDGPVTAPSLNAPPLRDTDRLGVQGKQVTDWNDATEPGWYWSNASAANKPPNTSTLLLGYVMAANGRAKQFVIEMNTGRYTTEHTRYVYPSGSSNWTVLSPAPFAMASGTASVAGTSGTQVNFPAGRFTEPPHVFAVPHHTSGQVAVVYQPNTITTSGFSCSIWTIGVNQIAGSIRWVAVQMTEGSASG